MNTITRSIQLRPTLAEERMKTYLAGDYVFGELGLPSSDNVIDDDIQVIKVQAKGRPINRFYGASAAFLADETLYEALTSAEEGITSLAGSLVTYHEAEARLTIAAPEASDEPQAAPAKETLIVRFGEIEQEVPADEAAPLWRFMRAEAYAEETTVVEETPTTDA